MSWQRIPLHLIVTGRTEVSGIEHLFDSLKEYSGYRIFVDGEPHRCGQFNPSLSPKGSHNPRSARLQLERRVQESIRWVKANPAGLVLLVDDTESDSLGEITTRFRGYLDELSKPLRVLAPQRYSVHFLSPMIEAYFLGTGSGLNSILGVSVEIPPEADKESVRNPFGLIDDKVRERKAAHRHDSSVPGKYDKVEHGTALLKSLDIDVVLGNPSTCCWLRTLYKWTAVAAGFRPGRRFHLADGCLSPVTAAQIGFTHDGLIAGAEPDEPG
jgi:hypothetical protein